MTGKEKIRQELKRYELMSKVFMYHTEKLNQKLKNEKSGDEIKTDLEMFRIAVESWTCSEGNQNLLKEMEEYEEELDHLIEFPKSEDISNFLELSSSSILCSIANERMSIEKILKLHDLLYEMVNLDIPMPKVIDVKELRKFLDDCC